MKKKFMMVVICYDSNTKHVYGYVEHTSGQGLAYGSAQFDQYVDW